MMTKAVPSFSHSQRGAALVVGLVLLLVMTMLAVTGMTASTLDLTMAGNTQHAQNAFQAAESTIEAEFEQGGTGAGPPRVTNYVFGPATAGQGTTTFQATRLPPEGYSLTEYQADHYTITAAGTSSRNAASTHLQGFFEVIPTAN